MENQMLYPLSYNISGLAILFYDRKIYVFINTILLILSLLLATGHISYASPKKSAEELRIEDKRGDHENISGDEDAIQNILQLMEKETEIATGSRMNTDFVPGMVTLLHGNELEEKGVRTVYEALALVPGLNLTMNSSGIKGIVVRGIGGPKLKLMLNNIPMNNTLNGNSPALYDIPVEQVERIEVIRGSGAVIHGEYAYTGVINVITRKNSNRFFVRFGSFETYGGGAILAYALPEKDFHISLNIAGWDTDGADVESGPDRLYGTINQEISYAPGPTNESHDDLNSFLTLDYKNFSIVGQVISNHFGDYFGFGGTLPAPEDDKVQSNENKMLEVRQKLEFNPLCKILLKFGWRQFYNDLEAEIFPPGYAITPSFSLPEGISEKSYYKERQFYSSSELTWRGWNHQSLLVGVAASGAEVVEASLESNNIDQNWAVEDASRRVISVYMQDEIDVSDRLTITPGVRYDNYDDVGTSYTPRIAAVYRLKDKHILKAQYAEAFRPPSFSEIYGFGSRYASNEDLKPETNRTYELGYIYQGIQTTVRITPFFSMFKDLIFSDFLPEEGVSQYSNKSEAEQKGVEFELERQLGRSMRLDANVSYSYTEDKETGEEIPGSVNWLGNLGLTYQYQQNFTIMAIYRYVGEYHRSAYDTRDSLDGYNTIDITLSVFNPVWEGMILRCGIKNLFNENVVYPSITAAYPDDFTRAGSEWWVQLSYGF